MLKIWADKLYSTTAALKWLEQKHPKEKVVFASGATVLETRRGFPVRWSLQEFLQHRGVVMISKNLLAFKDGFLSFPFLMNLAFLVLSVLIWLRSQQWLFLFGVLIFGILVKQFLPYQLEIPAKDIQDIKVVVVPTVLGKSSLLTITTRSRVFSIVSSQILDEDAVPKTFRSKSGYNFEKGAVEESYDYKRKLATRISALQTLLWFFMSFSLYILCLLNNGFYYIKGDNPQDWALGSELLISGWLGLFAGAFGLPWLANPLLMIAWLVYLIKKNVTSFFFSLSALSLMVSFLSVKKILVDEGGNYAQITGYGLGYWYWISSAFVILIANVFELLLTRRQNNARQASPSNTET